MSTIAQVTRVLSGEAIYRLDESQPLPLCTDLRDRVRTVRGASASSRAIRIVSDLCDFANCALILGAARMLFGRDASFDPVLIVVPLIVCARFIDNNIEHGQINLPTVALTIWAIVLAEEDRAMPSGAMLAARDSHQTVRRARRAVSPARGKMAADPFFGRIWIVLLIWRRSWCLGRAGALAANARYLKVVSSMTDRYTMMLTNQSATSAMARLMSLGASAGRPPRRIGVVHRHRDRGWRSSSRL